MNENLRQAIDQFLTNLEGADLMDETRRHDLNRQLERLVASLDAQQESLSPLYGERYLNFVFVLRSSSLTRQDLRELDLQRIKREVLETGRELLE